MYKFELSEKEITTYQRWYKHKITKENKRFPVMFSFTQTGIGTRIDVVCGTQSKDITDYDCW